MNLRDSFKNYQTGTIQAAALAIFLFIVAILFLQYMIGNPIKDFALRFFVNSTDGKLVAANEYEYDDERGKTEFHSSYTYTYSIGSRFYSKERKGRGHLHFPPDLPIEFTETYHGSTLLKPSKVMIEYVYFLPSVSQIKGTGYNTLFSYVIKSLLLKSLVYIVVFVGFYRYVRKHILL